MEEARAATPQDPDAVLEVGGRCFPVNRWALACHSHYFEAMFFGGTREQSQRHICLRGLEAEPFQALLDFTRTGLLPVSPPNVAALLETADFLQLEAAKRRCEAFLERQLHVSNCLGLLAYAQRFACRELCSAARHVALTHWAEVAGHEEFLELPKEALLALLASDELFVAQEEAVFQAVTRWVAADPGAREQDFLELAALIRVPFLSLPFLDLLVKRSKRPGPDLPSRLARALDGCPPPSWRHVADSPCAGRSYDALYVLSGKHDQEQQQLLQFQPKSGRWRARAPLTRKNLTQYAVAVAGNLLFVTGGYLREEFFWSATDGVWIYNSWDDGWLEGPRLRKARHSHCAVGVGFHVYVLGGSTEEGGITPEVERLSPAGSSWESTSPLVHAVERAGAASLGARVYVACGLDGNGDVCPAVQRLDVERDLWEVVSFSPLPRYDLCVAALNGALYTVGGGALRFDVGTGEWTPVEEARLGRSFFQGCAVANGRLYLLARRQGNGALPNLVLLDPYLDLCQELDPKIPCPLPIHAAATLRRFDTWA